DWPARVYYTPTEEMKGRLSHDPMCAMQLPRRLRPSRTTTLASSAFEVGHAATPRPEAPGDTQARGRLDRPPEARTLGTGNERGRPGAGRPRVWPGDCFRGPVSDLGGPTRPTFRGAEVAVAGVNAGRPAASPVE